jgi:DNA repair photolyase
MVEAQPVTHHLEAARTVLRDQGQTDAWFVARYGMNLYRGCEHGCAYCDGRAERYRVAGRFDRDIVVKSNAMFLLRRELSRLPEPGFVFLGGGVCDAWQPAEARHRLARGALELLLEYGLPVHVLTKSALVERDLDLLAAIHQRSRAVLAFSIATADERLREGMEPGAAPIAERFRLLRRAKAMGIVTGIAMMPLLPGLSDRPEHIDSLLAQAADAGVDFALCGGLTLRPGVQKQHYLEALAELGPDLAPGTTRLYAADQPSGAPDSAYQRRLEPRIVQGLRAAGLPQRIPRAVFSGLLPQYAEAAVLLEHQAQASAEGGRRAVWLARSGHALQRWARRGLVSLRRRRRGGWQQIEQRFRELVQRGQLAQIPELDPRAIPALESLVQSMPAPRGSAQLSLL